MITNALINLAAKLHHLARNGNPSIIRIEKEKVLEWANMLDEGNSALESALKQNEELLDRLSRISRSVSRTSEDNFKKRSVIRSHIDRLDECKAELSRELQHSEGN